MEVENHKQALNQQFNKLYELLTKRNIQLLVDNEISDSRKVFFNGFMTTEGFEYEILDTLLPKLTLALDDFEFYELNKEKLRDIKQFMARKLLNYVIEPFDKMIFSDQISSFDEVQNMEVSEFIAVQEKLRTIIARKLDVNFESNLPQRKIKWQGTQIQFCELLVELEKKKWIETMDIDTKPDIVKSFASVFDFSSTQKSSDSSTAISSISRTMRSKLELVNGFYEEIYGQIYKDNYLPKFSEIEQNPKF